MSSSQDRSSDNRHQMQYLMWQNRRLTAAPEEFQRLFEDIASRHYEGFERVRSYGSIGDRKADGIIRTEGVVFQVYSPDQVRQAETMKKIEDDLSGAISHWKENLKKWVFVYNARKGLPPDVPLLLQSQQKKYPGIKIEHLSADNLWSMLRGLPVKDISEILGPVPEKLREAGSSAKVMLFQAGLSPIDERAAKVAMAPHVPMGPPVQLMPLWDGESWEQIAGQQRRVVEEFLHDDQGPDPDFAVFSIAPIPLVTQLGYLLSDRVKVTPFQFDRTRGEWSWPDGAEYDDEIKVEGLPNEPQADARDVIVRVSLSAQVSHADTADVGVSSPIEIDIRVADPNRRWLKHPNQLDELDNAVRNVMDSINESAPNCERVHLFYAGPTGGALKIGQAVNPRMDPSMVLYEYSRKSTPRYTPVLVLE